MCSCPSCAGDEKHLHCSPRRHHHVARHRPAHDPAVPITPVRATLQGAHAAVNAASLAGHVPPPLVRVRADSTHPDQDRPVVIIKAAFLDGAAARATVSACMHACMHGPARARALPHQEFRWGRCIRVLCGRVVTVACILLAVSRGAVPMVLCLAAAGCAAAVAPSFPAAVRVTRCPQQPPRPALHRPPLPLLSLPLPPPTAPPPPALQPMLEAFSPWCCKPQEHALVMLPLAVVLGPCSADKGLQRTC